MYLGRYQQGEEVPLCVLCTDALGNPVAPDAAPQARIYSDSAVVTTGRKIPALDPVAATGLFASTLYLDENYPAGSYTVKFSWTAGAHTGGTLATFEVPDGGDPSGQVIALTWFPRPDATYYPNQRSSGRLFRGKNPRV